MPSIRNSAVAVAQKAIQVHETLFSIATNKNTSKALARIIGKMYGSEISPLLKHNALLLMELKKNPSLESVRPPVASIKVNSLGSKDPKTIANDLFVAAARKNVKDLCQKYSEAFATDNKEEIAKIEAEIIKVIDFASENSCDPKKTSDDLFLLATDNFPKVDFGRALNVNLSSITNSSVGLGSNADAFLSRYTRSVEITQHNQQGSKPKR